LKQAFFDDWFSASGNVKQARGQTGTMSTHFAISQPGGAPWWIGCATGPSGRFPPRIAMMDATDSGDGDVKNGEGEGWT